LRTSELPRRSARSIAHRRTRRVHAPMPWLGPPGLSPIGCTTGGAAWQAAGTGNRCSMGHGKDGTKDVISELTADHREVDELFSRFEDVRPGTEDRKRLADTITIELVRHSVAEEQHFYPAVREHVA